LAEEVHLKDNSPDMDALPFSHETRTRIGWGATVVTTALGVVQLFAPVPGRLVVGRYEVPLWWVAAIAFGVLTAWSTINALRQENTGLKGRLTPRLLLDVGNGSPFDVRLTIDQTYGWANRATQEVWVNEAGRMKVVQVTNDSDVDVRGVKVEIVASSHMSPLPYALPWVHNRDHVTDLAPRATAVATLGLTSELGISTPDGGGRHEWVEVEGLCKLPNGAVLTARVWAPEVVGQVRTFQLDHPPSGDHPWWPIVTEVDEVPS
jgi:hypothetical protein